MRRVSSRKTQQRKAKKRQSASAGRSNSHAVTGLTKKRQPTHARKSNLQKRGSGNHRQLGRRRDAGAVARWLDSRGSGRALMDIAHDAIIIRNPSSVVESWNKSATRLYGWSAKQALGKVTHTLLETKFPSSKQAVDEALFQKGHWEGELHHRRKDGTQIVVESRQSLLRDAAGKPLLIKEINRDITQQRRQLSYLRLLSEVSACVNEAPTVEDALRGSLASICVQTNWCAARACIVSPDGSGAVQNSSAWFLSDEQRFGPFRDATDAGMKIPGEKRVAARVFKKGGPVWIPDIGKDAHFAGMRQAIDAGLKCAYGFPVFLGPKAGIVMVLFSDVPIQLDEVFSATMGGVGRHLGRLFERLGAEGAQRVLSVSLMRAQDDERRRVARELHDSTGQYLSALTLALDAARSHGDAIPPAAVRKLEEASEIVNRCSAEIRTLSHLLHPPLLEELGLASAVNWYVDGFAERSGLKVHLEVPARMARFDPSVELALFRALQECLTNIHRHSGSKTASVKIETDDHRLTLEVRDEGKGIEQEMLGNWFGDKRRSGVGISGMRERMKDLGGTLEILSSSAGTTVRATIPLRRRPTADGVVLAESSLRAAPPVRAMGAVTR